ncbi:MAG: hypothetical protein IJ689_03645 [Alphaproteobacteria bacterium]|nr:hypothetical protein [Alphaproteobacteria bacterium]
MTDYEKKVAGVFYQVDEENKIITYDPQNNHQGRWDYNIQETTSNMAEIAKKTGYEVQATFNGTKFSVTPGMTAEDGEKAWDAAMEKKRQDYLNSPQYKIDQMRRAKEEEKRKQERLADDRLIEGIKLDTEGHTLAFEESKKKNSDSYGKGIIAYADRWGRMMQAKMAEQGLTHLTLEIANSTEMRADIYGMSGSSAGFARGLLVRTWKYGRELGEINGYEADKITFYRTISRDDVIELGERVKENPDLLKGKDYAETLEKHARSLSAVFPDEMLIKKLVNDNTEGGTLDVEGMKLDLPMLSGLSSRGQMIDVCDRAIELDLERKAALAKNKNHTQGE